MEIKLCPWCKAIIVLDPESGVTLCRECDHPVGDHEALSIIDDEPERGR